MVTTNSTITGWVNFNLANMNFDFLIFALFMSIGVLVANGYAVRANVDKQAQLLVNLTGLLFGSIFGLLAGNVSIAIPFIFGFLFAIYIWRGT